MTKSKANYITMVRNQLNLGEFQEVVKGNGPKVMKYLQGMKALAPHQVFMFFVKLTDGVMLLVNPSTCCGSPHNNSVGQCVVYGNYKGKWIKTTGDNLTMHHFDPPRATQCHPEMALWSSDPNGPDGPTGLHFTANKTGTLWIQGNTLTPQILAGDLRADYPVLGQQSWGPLCKGYKIKAITVYTAKYSPRTQSLRSIPSRPGSNPNSRPTTPRASDSSRSLTEEFTQYTASPVVMEPPIAYLDAIGYADPYAVTGQPVYTGEMGYATNMVQTMPAEAWPVYVENGVTPPLSPIPEGAMQCPPLSDW